MGTTSGSPITRTWCLLGVAADNPLAARRRSTTVPLTCSPGFGRAGADHQHRDVVHQVAPVNSSMARRIDATSWSGAGGPGWPVRRPAGRRSRCCPCRAPGPPRRVQEQHVPELQGQFLRGGLGVGEQPERQATAAHHPDPAVRPQHRRGRVTGAAQHHPQLVALPVRCAMLAVTNPPSSAAVGHTISLVPASTSPGSAQRRARTRIACRAAAIATAASSPTPRRRRRPGPSRLGSGRRRRSRRRPPGPRRWRRIIAAICTPGISGRRLGTRLACSASRCRTGA